nr:hypothetical protein JG3_0040 [uncultured bacterium]
MNRLLFRLAVVAGLIANIFIGFRFWSGWCGFFFFVPAIIAMVLFSIVLLLFTSRVNRASSRTLFALIVFILSQTLYAISGFLGWGDGTPSGPHVLWRGEDGYFGINYYLHTDLPAKFFEGMQALAAAIFVCAFILLITFLVNDKRRVKQAA